MLCTLLYFCNTGGTLLKHELDVNFLAMLPLTKCSLRGAECLYLQAMLYTVNWPSCAPTN